MQAEAKFNVGDKVQPHYRYRSADAPRTLTVRWVSKCGELIATENNDHGHTCSEASLYQAAQ